jgi:outer membrane protein assembly factor BamB
VAPAKPFVEVEMKVKPSPLISRNNLSAYDATSGKVLWDRVNFVDYEKILEETHFLGAPLPVKGKLYVLNEKHEKDQKYGTLRLLTVDFDRKKWKGKIAISQTLVLSKIDGPDLVINAPLRRTQPLHIAQAGDLLVCPTHAGVLFGVEPGLRFARWQYRYRAEKTAAPKLPFWQAACPIVTKDRIVFTAADAPDIHCIDFDGKKKWVAEPDGDLYLAAVHEGLVLLVGKTHCRALSLDDGEVKWRIRLGQPAGVGVMDGSLYYLPIKDDAKGPSIWEIDIVKGKKVRRIEVPHPDALGNLALHRGMLVSQSVTHIAAFPLEAKAK